MLSIMHSVYSSIEPSFLTKMFLNSGPLMASMLWVVEIPKWRWDIWYLVRMPSCLHFLSSSQNTGPRVIRSVFFQQPSTIRWAMLVSVQSWCPLP